MEAEVKQVIKEKEYVHDNDRKEYASKGLAGTALGIAIGAGVLSLWGRGRGVGIGGGMPENVNINTVSDAISGRTGVAPTAFQAWEKGCDEALALTNTIWGIKVNTQEQMYNHPLLSTGRSLESLAQENEAYTQKLQALKQIPGITQQQRVSTPTPIWDEIDRIVSSLNDQERAVLNNNKEYYDNSMAIQEMVNSEVLLLVKGRIEGSAEGKAVLEQQLSFVRRTSKIAKEETARRDALFREYVTEHSDMTWQEFIDWKNGKPQQKSKK